MPVLSLPILWRALAARFRSTKPKSSPMQIRKVRFVVELTLKTPMPEDVLVDAMKDYAQTIAYIPFTSTDPRLDGVVPLAQTRIKAGAAP